MNYTIYTHLLHKQLQSKPHTQTYRCIPEQPLSNANLHLAGY